MGAPRSPAVIDPNSFSYTQTYFQVVPTGPDPRGPLGSSGPCSLGAGDLLFRGPFLDMLFGTALKQIQKNLREIPPNRIYSCVSLNCSLPLHHAS